MNSQSRHSLPLQKLAERPPLRKAKSPLRGGKSAKTAINPEVHSAEVKSLYQRAAEPDVSEEQIRNACGQLGAMSKDGLMRVAEAIGLAGMKSKKKDELLAEITLQLIESKGAAIRRAQLVDRPGSAANSLAKPPYSGPSQPRTQVSDFPTTLM